MTEQYRERVKKLLEAGKPKEMEAPKEDPIKTAIKKEGVKPLLKRIFNENWDYTLKEEVSPKRFIEINNEKNYPHVTKYWDSLTPGLRSSGCDFDGTTCTNKNFASEKGGFVIKLCRDDENSNRPCIVVSFGDSEYDHNTDYESVKEFFSDIGMGIEESVPTEDGVAIFVKP